MHRDLFHIVFIVTLLSAAIQGGGLPWVARKLQMVDDSQDVRKTFNDYQQEQVMQLTQVEITQTHPWAGKRIREISLPTGALAILVKRQGSRMVTRGDTQLLPGDKLILSVPPYAPSGEETLVEREILRGDEWAGKTIRQLKLPENEIIATILRQGQPIIPDGSTVIQEGDTVALYR